MPIAVPDDGHVTLESLADFVLQKVVDHNLSPRTPSVDVSSSGSLRRPFGSNQSMKHAVASKSNHGSVT